jgi:cytochrome P450
MAHDDASATLASGAPPQAGPATCPLADVNFFDPELLQDPHAYYRRLREEAPVFRDPKTGIVSVATYDLIMEVNRQPLVFSNTFGAALRAGAATGVDSEELSIMQQGIMVADTMLTADPPAHTRYRKLAMKAFTHKRVETMGAYVAKVAGELIDGFIDDGACEFKSAFANHLPMIVIADSLGAPREDMDRFHRWSDAFVTQLGGMADRETRLEAARRINEFQRYFIDIIEAKRTCPTDDVISDLVHATLAEEGDPRTMDYSELLSIIQQLLVAGNETTAHTLTTGLYYLISDPALLQRVLADRDLIPGFVEETLRLLTPTNNMWRVALKDAEIGGFPVSKGEMILVRYGSANRDIHQFPNPEEFDPARPGARDHLAFGAGIHTCIGAQLARKEMITAFGIVLDRLKNPRFAPGKNAFRYSPSILLRGVLELHVVFDQ